MKSESAIVLLVLLWAISRSKTATATAATPAAPAPAAKAPPARLPPVESRSPGVPQKMPRRATKRQWTEDTLRLFDEQISGTGVDPLIVLQGVAIRSEFDPGYYLGEYSGLLGVHRDQLRDVGYDGAQFWSLTSDEQIPWIARVIAHRIKTSGDKPPETIGDLAVLILGPYTKAPDAAIRMAAQGQAAAVVNSSEYKRNAALLQRVQQEE